MKNLIFSLSAFAVISAASPARAMVSCQVLEGDGAVASAATKIDAEKAAWRKCISKKVAMREGSRGPVSPDDADYDAESCINAKMKCQ